MDDNDLPLHQPHEDSSAGLGVRQFLTLGGMFVGCVVFGLAVGVGLDAWLGTSPLLLLVGTAFGVASAGFGFWYRVRAYLRNDAGTSGRGY